MRLFWPVVISTLLSISLTAQQRPQFSHSLINKYQINPAYGGMQKSLAVFMTYRDQYSAFPGNPRSFQCNADIPLFRLGGAAGASLTSVVTGLFRQTGFQASYNHVIGTRIGLLSFGGRMGVDVLQLNGNEITTPEGDYQAGVNHYDPLLAESIVSGTGLSWEAGVFFLNQEWQGGVSVVNFPSHATPLGPGLFTRTPYGVAFASYTWPQAKDLTLVPSVLVKWDNATIQMEMTGWAQWEDNLLLGIGFRGYSQGSRDAVIFYAGTNIGRKWRCYYSYDAGISGLASIHQGSHEITLGFNLQQRIGAGLPPKIIYNPRDL